MGKIVAVINYAEMARLLTKLRVQIREHVKEFPTRNSILDTVDEISDVLDTGIPPEVRKVVHR